MYTVRSFHSEVTDLQRSCKDSTTNFHIPCTENPQMRKFYYNCFILSLSLHTHTQKQICHLQQNLKTFLPKQIKTTMRYPLTSVRIRSDQIRSVAHSCLTLCNPMNRSTPGLPVHHQLPEFTETHIHWVGEAIQPSHPRSSPSPPAPNPSQHQSLFQWVNSSHEVAKVLEFQL